jgi:hypothetical protein
MTNPWKLATIGLALTGFTAVSTGMTTAYLVRPPAPADAQQVVEAPSAPPARVASAPAVRPAVRHASVAPRTAPAPLTRVASPAPPPVATSTTVTAGAPADCATGTDRAIRIAKPGAIGALLGAGLGAAGGAIADGGKAAGKGALIGGIAGAALGTGYGAYTTRNACGTIFGPTAGF